MSPPFFFENILFKVMKHKSGKIETAARRRLIQQAPSKLLPPYKGEGFCKGVKGYAEIVWNLVARNSVYNSRQFFYDLLPDIEFQDLKESNPVAAIFITSGQQAVLAISDNEDNPKFRVPKEASEIPVYFEGKACEIARASSSIPFLMSRHSMQVNGVKTYPTDGAAYRGLPCQFMRHKYRLALSTHTPPTEKIKPATPELTGWWILGVPFQMYTSLMTMLEGVTTKDNSAFKIVGDGNDETYELSHVLKCGDFRKENEIDVSWLNIGGHTPEVVGKLFNYGVNEANKFWQENEVHHNDIRQHGLAVCMTGGGGDGYAQCGFMARLRDLIGKPYAATAGVSAGAINAIFFSWLETQTKE